MVHCLSSSFHSVPLAAPSRPPCRASQISSQCPVAPPLGFHPVCPSWEGPPSTSLGTRCILWPDSTHIFFQCSSGISTSFLPSFVYCSFHLHYSVCLHLPCFGNTLCAYIFSTKLNAWRHLLNVMQWGAVTVSMALVCIPGLNPGFICASCVTLWKLLCLIYHTCKMRVKGLLWELKQVYTC